MRAAKPLGGPAGRQRADGVDRTVHVPAMLAPALGIIDASQALKSGIGR